MQPVRGPGPRPAASRYARAARTTLGGAWHVDRYPGPGPSDSPAVPPTCSRVRRAVVVPADLALAAPAEEIRAEHRRGRCYARRHLRVDTVVAYRSSRPGTPQAAVQEWEVRLAGGSAPGDDRSRPRLPCAARSRTLARLGRGLRRRRGCTPRGGATPPTSTASGRIIGEGATAVGVPELPSSPRPHRRPAHPDLGDAELDREEPATRAAAFASAVHAAHRLPQGQHRRATRAIVTGSCTTGRAMSSNRTRPSPIVPRPGPQRVGEPRAAKLRTTSFGSTNDYYGVTRRTRAGRPGSTDHPEGVLDHRGRERSTACWCGDRLDVGRPTSRHISIAGRRTDGDRERSRRRPRSGLQGSYAGLRPASSARLAVRLLGSVVRRPRGAMTRAHLREVRCRDARTFEVTDRARVLAGTERRRLVFTRSCPTARTTTSTSTATATPR